MQTENDFNNILQYKQYKIQYYPETMLQEIVFKLHGTVLVILHECNIKKFCHSVNIEVYTEYRSGKKHRRVIKLYTVNL